MAVRSSHKAFTLVHRKRYDKELAKYGNMKKMDALVSGVTFIISRNPDKGRGYDKNYRVITTDNYEDELFNIYYWIKSNNTGEIELMSFYKSDKPEPKVLF